MIPAFPVGAAGLFDEDDGEWVAASGLDEGEDFEAFVVGAEAAGEEGDGVGFLDEDEFAAEEIAEVDEFFVAFDEGVGFLFEGELDGDADGGGLAGAFVTGGHDAAAGAGDDHEAGFGEEVAELEGELVVGVVDFGAGPSRRRRLCGAGGSV